MSVHVHLSESSPLRGLENDHAISPSSPLRLEVQETFEPLQYFPAGIELYRQDMMPQEVYFLERGLVKHIRTENNGQEIITALYFNGAILGAETVIAREAHPVTAVTVINSSLRRVPAATFRHLLRTDVQLSGWLHQTQSRELIDKVIRISLLGCSSAEERLKALIIQLAQVQETRLLPEGLKFQLPLKHWEVAQLIAVTPPYLCRLFDKFEKNNLIRREKGWLIIPDLHKLSIK